MAIIWGFIGELEGEGLRTGEVPDPEGSQSGVTVGTGVDLGQMDAQSLAALDLPEPLVAKLTPYLGLKKQPAVDFLASHPLTLTVDEVDDLDGAVQAAKAAEIGRVYDAAVAARPGAVPFEELSDEAQTVICSVAFQYGANLARRTPKFWRACTEGRWADVEAELRAFGDRYPTRRRKEADLLATAPERT